MMRCSGTRTILTLAYYAGLVWSHAVVGNTETFEIRAYDGRNNNLEYPEWGAAYHARIRAYPPEHSFFDGTDEPLDEKNSNLPSGRRIMEGIFRKAKPHKDKIASHVSLEFGHFIAHDILGSRYNKSEPFSIPCDGELVDYVYCPVSGARAARSSGLSEPAVHRVFKFDLLQESGLDFNTTEPPQHSIPFNRDRYVRTDDDNPRATINGMTSYLDLSNIYGTNYDPAWGMRQEGGKLPLTEDGLLGDYFLHDDLKAGIDTSPGAYSIYIVFTRYHNRMAEEYKNSTPAATDEHIFELARRKTIAVYQSFVEENYLPTLLGDKLNPYEGYKPEIDPSIDEFFAAVSFRYGHSSFASLVRMVDEKYQPTPMDPLFLRDVFKSNVPKLVKDMGGIEPFLRGLTISQAKAIDASLVDDFNIWAEATSVLDIQRGRDVGIPRYNDVREAFGLRRMTSMEELVADRYGDSDNYHNDTDFISIVAALKELYSDDVDQVDAYVGALVEAPQSILDEMGPLLTLSIKNQFTRLRDGDRFWYKTLFPPEEYENFPDLSGIVKLVCEGMELFPDDPYILAARAGGDSTSGRGVCSAGATNQLSLLGGDFTVRWLVEESDLADKSSGDSNVRRLVKESDLADKSIEVTLTIQEEMEGPGYLGIGWGKLAMKGAHIWFCTVNADVLQAHSPMPSDCSSSTNSTNSKSPMFLCCLAPGTHHNIPACAEAGDDLFYPLQVQDWCVSSSQSYVTVRAPLCSDEPTAESESATACFRMESTPDGRMDFIVAYNTIANSRPHGYQRRTNAQVDLRAGFLTQSEAATADDGLIATHGAFMLIGWMLLAPWGVFIVRYMKTWKRRLVAHISIMGVVGSMMVPLLIGVEASVGATDKTAQHALVGLIIMCMFLLMAGTGRFRYLKWEGHKIGKKTDFLTLVFHKYGGAVFIGLAWWNCYTGLCRIGPEDSEFQLVLFSNLHLGYDIHAFGTIRVYVYGPYIAFVALVFILAEIRQIRMANASESALKSGTGLWGDDDDSDLDTMTLDTFLDVTRLGNALCVVDGRVLDITNFIDIHPGGPELLRYVRGSDITEEFVGHRDVDGVIHGHSHGALMLMKKFVKAKLVAAEGHLPKGRGSTVPGLKPSTLKDIMHAERSLSQPFRRGKVLDVRYLAPSASAEDQSKPVILLRVSLPRSNQPLQEKKVTKLPGCSFRFRGIDKRGLMFEREYTAVLLDRHTAKERSLSKIDTVTGSSQVSLRQLDLLLDSSRSLAEEAGDESSEKEEIYDFVISLIAGGQMSEFFLGLKTGKLLLAQGPKVNPKTVYQIESEKWKSVVLLAAGTGITSMLQIIDYYLEQPPGRSDCPGLFLVWVLKSPAHSYHASLGLKERVRKSRGRLRWVTVYSSSCDDSAEQEKDPAAQKGFTKRSVSSPDSQLSRVPRRSVSSPASVGRLAAVPRLKAPSRHNVSFDSNSGEPQQSSWLRSSAFARPSAFTQRVVQGRLPTMTSIRMKNKTRLNVRDLTAFVKEDDFGTNDPSFLDGDSCTQFDGDYWRETPRQMTRHLDEDMLKEILWSVEEHTKQSRRENNDVSDIDGSTSEVEQEDEPANVVSFLRSYVTVEDRKDGMRLHKECFVSSEAIDYLLSFGYVSTREEGAKLGRALQERHQIKHVSVGCTFADDGEFFRFASGVSEGHAHAYASSDLPTVAEDDFTVNSGDLSSLWDASSGAYQSLSQSSRFVAQRRGPLTGGAGLDVEQAAKASLFKGTLVAVSGSPMFETVMAEMLQKTGFPIEQMMTFVGPTR